MTVEEVGGNKTARQQFLQLPVTLYKGNPFWVRPLDSDIEDVFDPEKNKMFRHGGCCRWLVKDQTGQPLGRIAAFYDKRVFKPGQPKTGGFGFFECTNNQPAAHLLLRTAEQWLAAQGIEGMDGSINFGDRDKHWGILVKGFDKEPNYGMPYTHPYYVDLFENYGLRVYYYQLTFSRVIMEKLNDGLLEKYRRVAQDGAYRFEYWNPANPDKYIKAFTEIYAQAWARHGGVPPMSEAHVRGLFAKMKPVMDKRLLWFGFYGERPVCFFLMLPELNQFFKHVDGKLNLWGKIKFAWYRYVVKTRKMFGVIFGVIPDFQGKGVEGAMIVACQQTVGIDYDVVEMNWIGDFNPKMIHVIENLGATEVKRHATYRLYFDRNHPFERHKAI